jgi:hypothetical protein
MVWRLWLRADVLLAKGDLTQILLVPIWPVAFVMAAGSIFYLTGVLVHLIAGARRVMGLDSTSPPPAVERPYSE